LQDFNAVFDFLTSFLLVPEKWAHWLGLAAAAKFCLVFYPANKIMAQRSERSQPAGLESKCISCFADSTENSEEAVF
jgi:hypothetical protein